MSKRTMGLLAMAAGAILGISGLAAAQEPVIARDHERPHHIFLIGKAHSTLEDALQGAMRRLSTPRCQQLFDEFTDQDGRALKLHLAVAAESPADFLTGLYFVEGDDTVQCRGDRIVAAFTEPGSRVIHVCGQRFLQFAVKTKGAEILLIHELLHALGLGENPPTSARITDAVMNRCG